MLLLKQGGGTFIANYNNLVSTGNANNYIGGVGTSFTPTLYQSFAEWQTGSGQDANSISVNPVFVSATNLHLTPVGNKDIDNKGTPVNGITTDIDNETRSTTKPDIGADEFTSTQSHQLLIDASITGVVLMQNLLVEVIQGKEKCVKY